MTGFGNGGYALFGRRPASTAPGRIRVLSNGQILAVGGIGCATNVNPNAPDVGVLHAAARPILGERRAGCIVRDRTVAS